MDHYKPESLFAVSQESPREHLPWYAIRVQSRFAKIASIILRDKGFEEFLPLYRTTRKWSDRVKQMNLPLFPGYLFCRLDVSEGLLPVLTTPGVLGVVSAGTEPISIPEEEIRVVQAVVRSGLPAIPWPALCAGSSVLIEHGPLAGVEGIVLGIDKKCRLVVSVSLLQRSVAVEVQREWVRPLAHAGKRPNSLSDGHSLRLSPQIA
jgi:transcription antitermination factor NusG